MGKREGWSDIDCMLGDFEDLIKDTIEKANFNICIENDLNWVELKIAPNRYSITYPFSELGFEMLYRSKSPAISICPVAGTPDSCMNCRHWEGHRLQKEEDVVSVCMIATPRITLTQGIDMARKAKAEGKNIELNKVFPDSLKTPTIASEFVAFFVESGLY